jgi:hypothetical protein
LDSTIHIQGGSSLLDMTTAYQSSLETHPDTSWIVLCQFSSHLSIPSCRHPKLSITESLLSPFVRLGLTRVSLMCLGTYSANLEPEHSLLPRHEDIVPSTRSSSSCKIFFSLAKE